jgi:hypothetical protein
MRVETIKGPDSLVEVIAYFFKEGQEDKEPGTTFSKTSHWVLGSEKKFRFNEDRILFSFQLIPLGAHPVRLESPFRSGMDYLISEYGWEETVNDPENFEELEKYAKHYLRSSNPLDKEPEVDEIRFYTAWEYDEGRSYSWEFGCEEFDPYAYLIGAVDGTAFDIIDLGDLDDK